LQMLKDGKINVNEALKLIEALEATEKPVNIPQARAKWFRVRITDMGSSKPKVMVNLPMGLVDWALKAGSKFANISGVDLQGINLDELREAIVRGARGKIVDVVDEEDKQHIEVIIE